MIPIPIKELAELSGCELEFARRQIYDGIKKGEIVEGVHWRRIRGAIVIDLERGLKFLALRRLAKEKQFLDKVIADPSQVLKKLKKPKRKIVENQLKFGTWVAKAGGDQMEIVQDDELPGEAEKG